MLLENYFNPTGYSAFLETLQTCWGAQTKKAMCFFWTFTKHAITFIKNSERWTGRTWGLSRHIVAAAWSIILVHSSKFLKQFRHELRLASSGICPPISKAKKLSSYENNTKVVLLFAFYETPRYPYRSKKYRLLLANSSFWTQSQLPPQSKILAT